MIPIKRPFLCFQAVWKMQYRGSLGEALIHILIMGNSLIHTKIARTLGSANQVRMHCNEGQLVMLHVVYKRQFNIFYV